jgi:ornithine cyclodeaminase/alanine dehydrogenase-like protein (mu-crystallin family)
MEGGRGVETLVLSIDDLRAIVDSVGLDVLMDQTIERLEETCLELRPGEIDVPVRDGLSNGQYGLLEWMPVRRGSRDLTLKIVSYYPTNPIERLLPTILSVGMAFDATCGHLLSLSDATFSTALRTGAASALATRVLANPDSRVLGLVGAGAQSLSQLHALSRVFELEEVLVFDTDSSVSNSFAARARMLGLNGTRFSSARLDEVTGRADIVCTSTSVKPDQGPVFDDVNLQVHLHVNAVGSDFPGKTELPLSLMKRSFVAVDFRDQAVREGEAQRLRDHEIGPDLIELVRGASQYEANRTQQTVFDSTGFALEDAVVIGLLHDHARDISVGTLCEIEAIGNDPTNPYSFLEKTINAHPDVNTEGDRTQQHRAHSKR